MFFRTELEQLTSKLRVVGIGVASLVLGSFGILSVAQAQQSGSTQPAPLADGTYLYGQTAQPNQIRQGYVVFSHQDGRVVGATYFPRSHFDCFTGALQNKTLNVKSSGVENPKNVATKIKLSELYPIQKVSENDRRILSTCRKGTVAIADS